MSPEQKLLGGREGAQGGRELTPEQQAEEEEIDKWVAKIMDPRYKEMRELQRKLMIIPPGFFDQPMTI